MPRKAPSTENNQLAPSFHRDLVVVLKSARSIDKRAIALKSARGVDQRTIALLESARGIDEGAVALLEGARSVDERAIALLDGARGGEVGDGHYDWGWVVT